MWWNQRQRCNSDRKGQQRKGKGVTSDARAKRSSAWRGLALEPLEQRQLLTVDALGTGASLMTSPIAPGDMVLTTATLPEGNDGTPDTVLVQTRDDQLELVVNGTVVTTEPLSQVNSLTIVGSDDNDTITLRGTFPFDVALDGGAGFDDIVIEGAQQQSSVNYRPTATDAGAIDVGATGLDDYTITFTGFEPVTVNGVSSVTFTTPGDADVLTVDSPTAGQNRISGTSDGIPLESLTFYDVANVTIDAAANTAGGSDSITIETPLVAEGLQNLAILTGSGDDTLTVGADFGLTFAGSTFTYDAGAGTDRIVASGDADFTLTDTQLTAGGLTGNGSIALGSTVERATLTGGVSDNTLDAHAFTLGPVTLAGLEGDDLLVGTAASDRLDGGSNDDTFVGNGGTDAVIGGTSGALGDTLLVEGTAGDDTISLGLNASGALVVTINGTTTTYTNSVGGPIETAGIDRVAVNTYDGDDTLAIDDTYDILPFASGVDFDGGTGYDTLNLAGGFAFLTSYYVGPFTGQGEHVLLAPSGVQNVRFENVEPVVDTVSAYQLSVFGTDGNNAINYRQGTNPANGLVTVDTIQAIEFANKSQLAIQGQAGDDTINLNNATVPTGLTAIQIAGGDTTVGDTLIVNGTSGQDTITYTPTAANAATITGAGPLAVVATTIEKVKVNGQGGDDTFTVQGTSDNDQIVHTPGATADTGMLQVNSLVPVEYQNLGQTPTINISGGGGSLDELVVVGTEASDAFNVLATSNSVSMVSTGGATVTLNPTDVELLTLSGLGGGDLFELDSALPYTSIAIDGGDADENDIVRVTSASGTAEIFEVYPVTPDSFALLMPGTQVSAQSVGHLNLTGQAATGDNDDIVVHENAANNTWEVSKAEIPNMVRVQIDDLTTVELAGFNDVTLENGPATPAGVDLFRIYPTGLDQAFTGTLTVEGSDDDSLEIIGTDADDALTIGPGTSTQGSVVGNGTSLVFNGIATATLVGLEGDDTFAVEPIADVRLVIEGDGPTASDVLNVVVPGDVEIAHGAVASSGVITTMMVRQPVDFSGIELINITSNTADSEMVVRATGDADQISVTRNDTTGKATVAVNDGTAIKFATNDTIGALFVVGLEGDDAFFVDPLMGVEVIVDGGASTASDSVVVDATADVTVSPGDTPNVDRAVVTVAGFAAVRVGATEKLTVTGGGLGANLTVEGTAGDDVFEYLPGTSVDSGRVEIVDQADDKTLLAVNFENLGLAASVTLQDNGGTDQLAYTATEADDSIAVTGSAGIGMVDHGKFLPVATDGIENLQLDGLGGVDSFSISVGHPFALIDVLGGDVDAGDTLTLLGDTNIQNIEVDLDANTVTGFGGTVAHVGVEEVVLDGQSSTVGDTLTVFGTPQDDRIIYTPTDTASGNFYLDEQNVAYSFARINGTFLIAGASDLADEVVVRGTNSHDVITIDSPARTVDVENAVGTLLKTVTLADDVEIVTAEAGLGNDTFLVINAPQVGSLAAGRLPTNLLINVDGGAPGTGDALVIASDRNGTALPVTDFVVINRSRTADEGVVRMFRDATGTVGDESPNVATAPILLPDITYTNVEVVSPVFASGTTEPNLLILGPDDYEQNEYINTPAYIGTGETLNVTDLAIFPTIGENAFVPSDVDWFHFVPETTGTLDIQVYFEGYNPELLPEGGDLDIEVYDEDGNLIAGTGDFGNNEGPIDDNERARIPVVAGQTYYLRVFGRSPLGANGYNLSITNLAPPTPYDLELQDAPVDGTTNPPGDSDNSDTGRSQLDNITYDATPTVWFRLDDGILLNDLPGNASTNDPPDEVIPIPFDSEQTADPTQAGYRVAVFVESDPQEPIGYARLVAEGVYVFDFATDTIDGQPYVLADGSHFISARVQMIDPSAELETGWGARSESLEIVVDTTAPEVYFGFDGVDNDGLHPDSDSGVEDQPDTSVDRITSDTTPTFWGTAEANTIVRVYADVDGDGLLDPEVDVLLGETVAVPLDGTNQFPGGQWQLTSTIDLNDPNYFSEIDGLRTVFVTGEDVAGNITDVLMPDTDLLDIFIDTRGPQVADVVISDAADYDLFDPKPSEDGPTSLVNSLDIVFVDQPERYTNGTTFVYPAVNEQLATAAGNITVVGDHVGNIAIEWIEFIDSSEASEPGQTTVRLHFAEPLPDDRFTVTVSDSITDDAGNALDGESNAAEPQENPELPSGDGEPGGDFSARFTVDSRPEIATWVAGSVYVDTNGNWVFDPQNENQNQDSTNVDLIYHYGFTSDDIFAGNFVGSANGTADGFDKLAAYGLVDGEYRWLIDTNNDGVADLNITGLSEQGVVGPGIVDPMGINGLPVAGNFDGNAANGDEVALFTGDTWWLDTDHDFNVDTAIPSAIAGYPIVGDFDGDGLDDLATWTDDVFRFDLAANGFGQQDATIEFGFIGVRERPVAADMDQDGIDDIGLWVPDRSGQVPEEQAEWYFLMSADANGTKRQTGSVVTLDHAFSPTPLGDDTTATFGDDYALPVVGNFDPPVAQAADATETVIDGTVGDDVIQISYRADLGVWVAVVNGVSQQLGTEVTTIEINGSGGDDQLTITGTAADETVEAWAYKTVMVSGDVTITALDFATVEVNGSGGNDIATLHDTAENDLFVGWTNGGVMIGGGINNRVEGFAEVYGQSESGGVDTAKFYDSPGDDFFIATPSYGQLTGDGYLLEAKGFDGVHGYATSGGADEAKLYDSINDDMLWGSPIEVAFFGDGFYNRTKFFEVVNAYSSIGGVDEAKLLDSAGDDTFIARPEEAALYGDGFYTRVKLFEGVHAYAFYGGVDEARFYDSAGDDTFYASGTQAALYGEGYYNRAKFFEGAHAYADQGGNDQALFYGTDGDDTLDARANQVSLLGKGYYNRAKFFESLAIHGEGLGTDRATLYDATLEEPDASLTPSQLAWLYDFEEVFSKDSSNDDEPTAEVVDDIFAAYWP